MIQFALSSSATSDEVAHLPAGYSYWTWNDYRMNPEHPPLMKKLAALPLLADFVWPGDIQLRPQDTQPRAITDCERSIRRAWAVGLNQVEMQWIFGHDFLYSVRPEAQRRLGAAHITLVPTEEPPDKNDVLNDADGLLFRGRMMVLLLGVCLASLVFLWSRQMFGLAGGVFSLALFCFDPNFIAHSRLVTTDVGVALFMFGAVYFLWRLCRQITALNSTLFLLFFGLAFVTKFSAVLLIPIFWMTVLGKILSPQTWSIGVNRGREIKTRTGRLAFLSAVSSRSCSPG